MYTVISIFNETHPIENDQDTPWFSVHREPPTPHRPHVLRSIESRMR